jgi:hypothetical protein
MEVPRKSKGKIQANVPSTNVKDWVRFNMETDANTRGKGSSRKSVEMEPAHKAIINVYQLVDLFKKKKNSTSKTMKGKKTNRRTPQAEEYFEKAREKEPSPYMNGRERYKDNGDLVPMNGESEIGYNQALARHRQLEEVDRQKEMAASMERTAQDIQAQRIAGEKAVKRAAVNDVKTQLRNRIKKQDIAYTSDAKRWDTDETYEAIPLDTSENVQKINDAITYAQKSGKMSRVPPPVVAFGNKMNSPLSTTTVYIKKDIENYRKKKLIHTKVKRTINKKRRVVMKKKGGKR